MMELQPQYIVDDKLNKKAANIQRPSQYLLRPSGEGLDEGIK